MRMIKLISVAACIIAFFASLSAAKEPIRLGAILSVTGPASFLGAPEARTLEMLVQEINAKGGLNGNKIELIIKDSGSNPEKAISFAKQLIEEEKVFAIIGPSTSGETMAIKGISEEGKTTLLSCAAAEAIVTPVAPHVFTVAPKDSYAVTRIFQQMKKMGISRVGLLSSNTGFGKAGKEQIEKLAPQYGIQIPLNEVYDKAATDLTAEATKLKGANIQAVINWSIEPAQAIVIKNIRQIGMTVPIFQSHGFANIQYARAAGAAAEGVIFPAGRLIVADLLSSKNPQKAILESYKKRYESKYKEDVSTFGGHAYDSFMILARAIKEAGLDREKVRATIENMKGFIGTAGVFNFSPTDHNGLDINAFEMITVKDGRFTLLKQ
ncbi:MAG TPA: branched-chain amino acid ABC transporter substrate-binding protein [Nitrospiraceae bacterium]|jgi:branched-chain amino acid transport system substrate-binding protein|nr:branched-chain amino acid ABC transporter substrate-binding protein [Nitrospiraceae bacterium]